MSFTIPTAHVRRCLAQWRPKCRGRVGRYSLRRSSVLKRASIWSSNSSTISAGTNRWQSATERENRVRTVLFDFVLHGFAEVDETLGEQPGADGADAEHVLALQ